MTDTPSSHDLKSRAGRAWRVAADTARADAVRLWGEIRAVRFRRPGRRALMALASVFAVLSIAIVMFAAFFEWNHLRGPIGRYASGRLDREVRITGDLDVKLFSWTPRITADGITVAQPAWAGRGRMAEVQRLTVEVELLPLLRGQVRLPLLAVQSPRIDLRRNAAGQANWDFGDPDKPKEPAKLPFIRNFIIADGRLSFNDAARGMRFDGTVSTREAAGQNSASAFRLRGEGQLKNEPFTLSITGGPLVNVRPDRPYPFDAEVRGGATRITARGEVPKPFDLGVITASITASGADLADVYDLTGVTTPNTPPYRLSGRLSRDGTTWRLRRMNGRVGDSDLSGDLTFETGRERPKLTAELRSRSLDFDDLAAIGGGAPDPRETANAAQKAIASELRGAGRFLPDAPLQTERLRAMDADVSYRASSVRARAFPIRQVVLDLTLKSGVLTLNPVSFRFPQGELSAQVEIDGRKDVPVTALDARLKGVAVSSLVPARGGVAPIEGTLHARAKLRGAGLSVREVASNADGGVTFVLPRGEIREAFAELLGINAGRGLLLLLSKDEGRTPIRCGVADFAVRSGTLQTRRMVIDTGVVLVKGSGSINLDDETMNLLIDGETKRPRLLRVWSPITVQGRLVKPAVGVRTGEVAAQGGLALALGALISPIAALLPFVDPGLAEDADCGALIASAARTGSAVTSTVRR